MLKIKPDKQLHFLVGFSLGTLTSIPSGKLKLTFLAVSIIIFLAKEFYDCFKKDGTGFSISDIVADILGFLAGFIGGYYASKF
jgi:uncharacterized protein YfiM (DUF2279 family)